MQSHETPTPETPGGEIQKSEAQDSLSSMTLEQKEAQDSLTLEQTLEQKVAAAYANAEVQEQTAKRPGWMLFAGILGAAILIIGGGIYAFKNRSTPANADVTAAQTALRVDPQAQNVQPLNASASGDAERDVAARSVTINANTQSNSTTENYDSSSSSTGTFDILSSGNANDVEIIDDTNAANTNVNSNRANANRNANTNIANESNATNAGVTSTTSTRGNSNANSPRGVPAVNASNNNAPTNTAPPAPLPRQTPANSNSAEKPAS